MGFIYIFQGEKDHLYRMQDTTITTNNNKTEGKLVCSKTIEVTQILALSGKLLVTLSSKRSVENQIMLSESSPMTVLWEVIP